MTAAVLTSPDTTLLMIGLLSPGPFINFTVLVQSRIAMALAHFRDFKVDQFAGIDHLHNLKAWGGM